MGTQEDRIAKIVAEIDGQEQNKWDTYYDPALLDANAKQGTGRRVSVVRSDGQRYPSIAIAARSLHISQSLIYSSLKYGDVVGGFTWSYADRPTERQRRPDGMVRNTENPQDIRQSGRPSRPARPVVRTEDGMRFDSAQIAANETGTPLSGIRSSLVTGVIAGGYHWRYEDSEAVPAQRSRKKRVRRIEDGVIFESLAAAGKAMNINPDYIGLAIKNGSECGGFHWERMDTQ